MALVSIETAGRRGTPDWQLDRMVESAAAQAWEDNQPEPVALSRYDFESINAAWAALETMGTSFNLLENNFADAMKFIDGTPEADKLASLFDSMADIATAVREIKKTLRVESHNAWTERRFAG